MARTIGITLSGKALGRIWANGLYQNALTLYSLLRSVEEYDVYLILTGVEDDSEKADKSGLKYVTYGSLGRENSNKFDLILEVGF